MTTQDIIKALSFGQQTAANIVRFSLELPANRDNMRQVRAILRDLSQAGVVRSRVSGEEQLWRLV